ncbi:MAG: hypothetical protein AAF542_25435 [Pseudomonadota bacterium]
MITRKGTIIIPRANNEFLNDYLSGIKKRSKAIKHRVSDIVCERLIVEIDGKRLEKIEFELIPLHGLNRRCVLQFDVWEDRWIDLLFEEWKNRKSRWTWSHEGILHPVYEGASLVKFVEQTIGCSFEMTASQTAKFEEVWRPLFVRKPELIDKKE